jgi:hypothetical protein
MGNVDVANPKICVRTSFKLAGTRKNCWKKKKDETAGI